MVQGIPIFRNVSELKMLSPKHNSEQCKNRQRWKYTCPRLTQVHQNQMQGKFVMTSENVFQQNGKTFSAKGTKISDVAFGCFPQFLKSYTRMSEELDLIKCESLNFSSHTLWSCVGVLQGKYWRKQIHIRRSYWQDEWSFPFSPQDGNYCQHIRVYT